jgi:hypothetical protein
MSPPSSGSQEETGVNAGKEERYIPEDRNSFHRGTALATEKSGRKASGPGSATLLHCEGGPRCTH